MENTRKHRSASDDATPPDAAPGRAGDDADAASSGAIETVARALDDALAGIARSGPIAVALSGGLDSMVLLDALARWRAPALPPGPGVACVALHVHHGLSPAADAWQRHCEDACAARGVLFRGERVTVGDGAGQGIEATARRLRYAALARLAREQGASAMLLAQHADDQAETVLLQMLRGAGLPGLSAMPVARAFGEADASFPLLRPFLGLRRDVLAAYAAERALTWVEDPSNQDARHRRNALRHQVFPAIAAHFPDYRRTLARTARHAAAAQALCDELARDDLLACAEASDGGAVGALPAMPVLARTALRRLSARRLANVLRFWMRNAGLPAASEARLGEMIRQLHAPPVAGGDPGATPRIEIAHAGHRLLGYRDQLFWIRDVPAGQAASGTRAACCRYTGQAVWRLPAWHGELRFEPDADSPRGEAPSPAATGTPDAVRTLPVADAMAPGAARTDDVRHAIGDSVVVPAARLHGAVLSAREREGGERLRLGPGRPSRALKQLFQQAGIASAQRALPLFHLDGELFFVPRLGGSVPPARTVGDIARDPANGPSTGADALIRLRWIAWRHAGD